jgi:hypothetical protein
MTIAAKSDHALITVYGDTPQRDIAKSLSLYLPDKDIRILEPDSIETLESAAKNSVLIFIGINNAGDPNLALGKQLQENPLISADIIAFALQDQNLSSIEVMSRGFDSYITAQESRKIEFKLFLSTKIGKGTRRLNTQIQEEGFRRLNDALSIAPVSMVIFDSDKRAVFVSDHYFRAYPKIAPRLIRGLRVYDAFEMMAKEENLSPEDPRYEQIQRFWHNLNGSIEFTLDDGTSYRLKAEPLPNKRGTVVTGLNISTLKKH